MSLPTEPVLTVKQWLLAKHDDIEDIDLDLDLIENRILNSLDFMDFIYFLEELVERELDIEAGSVEAFRTLRLINERIIRGSE